MGNRIPGHKGSIKLRVPSERGSQRKEEGKKLVVVQNEEAKQTALEKLVAECGLQIIPWEDLAFDDTVADNAVGQGAAGAVLKARYKLSTVAVKKFYQEQDFIDELACLSELRSVPNIVHIYGICIQPKKWALVMKYMPEGSLRKLLQDPTKEYDWLFYLLVAKDVASVLHSLHSLGYMHRDLKPGNLLISSYSMKEDETRIVLCDFGIAKKQDMTKTVLIGTPIYMAPELCGRIPEVGEEAHYSAAVDVYAYGMILWELLTRVIPYAECTTMRQLFEAVQSGRRPKIPPACPAEISDLIRDCWNPRASERPTFEQIYNNLSRIQRKVGALLPPVSEFFQLKMQTSAKEKPTKGSDVCVFLQDKLRAILAGDYAPPLLIHEVLTSVKLAQLALDNLEIVPFGDNAKRKKGKVRRSMNTILEGMRELVEDAYQKGDDGSPYFDEAACLGGMLNNWFQYLPLEHLASMAIRLATTVLSLGGCRDIVSKEILEGLGLSKEGFTFWRRYIGDSVLAVTWDDFAEYVQMFVRRKMEDDILAELKAFLDPGDTSLVTVFKFAGFIELFAGLEDSIVNMHNLIRCPYFVGHMGHEECVSLLRTEPEGTFFLRFSDGSYSNLTLVLRTADGIEVSDGHSFHPTLLSVEELSKSIEGLKYPYQQRLNWAGTFLGCIPSAKASQLLRGLAKGTYLLRLSASKPGNAAITYIFDDGTIHHMLIELLPGNGGCILDGHKFANVSQAIESYRHVFKIAGPLSEHHDDVPQLIKTVLDLVAQYEENNYDIVLKDQFE